MSSGFGANILVTGADRGIGHGLVQAFAKRDEVKNIFAACYDPEQAEHFHQKVIVIKMDVENDKSIDDAYDETVKLLGNEPLNLLINNAGIGGREGTAYDNAERDAFQKVFNVNATAPAMVTKKFLPLIEKADKEGQRAMIINIGSYGGSISIGYMVRVNIVYGMSKAALHFYTQLMSKFMADTGLHQSSLQRFNCLVWLRNAAASRILQLE
uniref:Uncharacterized protein n=1 Tax=Acrobeloides nanus TaxID=290746 RepID=A0A914E958_9BILA